MLHHLMNHYCLLGVVWTAKLKGFLKLPTPLAKVNVVDGINPYSNKHLPIFTYCKTPYPINRFTPSFAHRVTTIDHIDNGKSQHVRVHSGYAKII